MRELLARIDSSVHFEQRASLTAQVLHELRRKLGDDLLCQIAEAGKDRVEIMPCKVGDTVFLEAEVMGCIIGKMPFTVEGISVDLYGDWGGATQHRTISLDEAAAALKGATE